jgi:hypothetical protein
MSQRLMMEEIINSSLSGLKAYIEDKQWKGYDPYDALNSPFLRAFSFSMRSLRILYTQGLKRFPLNTRKLLIIKEGFNPKAMGLFLSSYLALYRTSGSREYIKKAKFFIDWLMDNSLDGYAGPCWGYNFHWQSRAFFAPAGTPTAVNTCFIANAFLDAYEVLGDGRYLEIARKSCDFIIRSLNIYKISDDKICFSYTPFDNLKVYNANLLSAALLSRVHFTTREEPLLDYAHRAVNFCVYYQNEDGSWGYGLAPSQNWVDNHHTGFLLESLYDYARFSDRSDIIANLDLGLGYYRRTFFEENGLPRCYNTKTYPADIHSAAESIIVFTRLRDLDTGNLGWAKKIALWTVTNMQDPKGYFYYQKHKHYSNKIPYMRWSQAWMFKALTYLAEALRITPVAAAGAGHLGPNRESDANLDRSGEFSSRSFLSTHYSSVGKSGTRCEDNRM